MNSNQQTANGNEGTISGQSVGASLQNIAAQLDKYAAMVGTGQVISIRCYDLRVLAEAVRADDARVAGLARAGHAVVDHWEQGDLAGAVHTLEGELDAVEG